MKLYQQPGSTVWWVTCQVQGKRVRRSTGCTDQGEALAWARENVRPLEQAQTARGLAVAVAELAATAEPVRLEEAWRQWEHLPKGRAAGARTAAYAAAVWGDWVAFLRDRYPAVKGLGDVRELHAQEYAHHLATVGRWQRQVVMVRQWPGKRARTSTTAASGPLAARSRNYYRMVCRAVFAALGERAGLRRNPWAAVPLARLDTRAREAFTREQITLILAAADGWQRPLHLLGMYTGMRLGDVCTLRWTEVDLAAGWITRRTAKADAVVRVPILPPLARELASLPQAGEYVLPEQAAQYAREPTAVGKRITDFFAGLGLAVTATPKGRSRAVSTLGYHSWRHTFASEAAQAGVPLSVLQAVVGHATAAMTRAYASHVGDAAARQALGRMPDFGAAAEAAPLAEKSAGELLARVQGPAEVLQELARRLATRGKGRKKPAPG